MNSNLFSFKHSANEQMCPKVTVLKIFPRQCLSKKVNRDTACPEYLPKTTNANLMVGSSWKLFLMWAVQHHFRKKLGFFCKLMSQGAPEARRGLWQVRIICQACPNALEGVRFCHIYEISHFHAFGQVVSRRPAESFLDGSGKNLWSHLSNREDWLIKTSFWGKTSTAYLSSSNQ